MVTQSAKESKIRIENLDFQVFMSFHSYSDEQNISGTLLHTHLFYELFACKQGELKIVTTQGDILLSSGDIAIIPLNRAHVLKPMAKNNNVYIISFLCKKTGAESNVNLYKKLGSIVNTDAHVFKSRCGDISEIERIYSDSLFESTENYWCALHFLELLLKIAKEKSDIEKKAQDGKESESTSHEIERMMKLDSIIATRYLEKYKAADYAKELFISTRQLDRIAIKRYGKSLYQLIVDNRVALAEHLLLSTDLTVDTIASSAGFSSNAGLYREFKKRKGLTPAEFRKHKEI